MIVITGSTGQLGQLVIRSLLKKVPAAQIVAAARNLEKAKPIAALGIEVRRADYTDPDSLVAALAGAEKLLLISSSEIGRRVPQHRAVIDAAKSAGVRFIVYTSLLHAANTPLALGKEHSATEALLRESRIPFIVLRNGWYTENFTNSASLAVTNGVVLGSAGTGRIASATRLDYAEAVATVLTRDNQPGVIYELAGDGAFTLAEYAAELARQSGKKVTYKNLPEAEYKAALVGLGLPDVIADVIANSSVGASTDALFDDGHQLSALIGRPTTPLSATIAAALEG